MSGGADGNLSDSSSAVSGLSLRDGNNQGQLVNHNLNLSTSSTSCDAHDPRTLEILRLRAEQQTLRAENCALKRRIRDMEQSDDDEEDDEEDLGHDGNKSWSELGKKRKKQLLSNISQSCALTCQDQINIYFAHITFQGILYICQELFTLQKSQQGAKYPNKQLRK